MFIRPSDGMKAALSSHWRRRCIVSANKSVRPRERDVRDTCPGGGLNVKLGGEGILDTLVIGAGPAGLTCAYSLAKAGRQAVVLEADPVQVGGISRTAEYKRFLFDIGGHRFFSKAK